MASYRGTTPEIRALLEHLDAAGYAVTLAAGSAHWRIEDNRGVFRAALPLTPSSNRAGDRARATLRHAGLPVPPSKHHKPKAQRTRAAR